MNKAQFTKATSYIRDRTLDTIGSLLGVQNQTGPVVMQRQYTANAASSVEAWRRRRRSLGTGAGAQGIAPTLLTGGQNRGIVTGGASLLGGGRA